MPARKRKGGKKKKKSAKSEMSPELAKMHAEAPRSVIFCRGKVGKKVNTLMSDWRQAMMPYTSSKLQKAKKTTQVKDILRLAKTFEASGMHVFSSAPSGAVLRLVKYPQGPTLSFRIESFKLRNDVREESRRDTKVVSDSTSYSRPALCVLNGFNTGERHVQLVATTFQGMFPTIHVDSFKLSHCRRVVLVNYNKASDVIDVRHYGIIAREGGLTRMAKKMTMKKLPKKVGELDDIGDLFSSRVADAQSDTDGEGEEVMLPQNFKHMQSGSQTKLKLHEIGPRITMSLMKVETGFWGGETAYHKLYEKTPEEVAETARRVKLRSRLKELRKDKQAENVARKRKAEEEKKEAKRARKAGKNAGPVETAEPAGEDDDDDLGNDDDLGDDDDLGGDDIADGIESDE